MSSNESNMDLFNELTVLLLARLYENFPVEQDILINDYAEFDNEEKNEIFFSTIKFLTKEEFITHTTQPYGGFIGVSLTSKGLNILGVKPVSVSKSASLVALFKDTLENGSIEAYKTCVKELTKAALTLSAEKLTKD